ncbi:MAG: C-terminal binding protein, partial [Chloroflexi bacterium]|nr:C-terminal binding protein [Chloroflexota bacterium]
CVDEVSDHAVALLLACARQIVPMHAAVLSREWSFEVAKPLFRLRGQTLGLVAFGKIARAVAAKGKAFGFHILGYDPYTPAQVFLDHGVQPASLGEVLTQSDFVSLHAPLSAETTHLIGEDELKAMKPTAYLINASRGGLVDEKALCKALSENWIAGAGLDVVENEPPDWNNPLFSLPNVVITPHAGFYSEDSLEDVRRRASQEVIRALTGEWPVCLLNQELKNKIEAPGR